MIGTIDIRVQAANPNIPLATLRAFLNSPSNVRIRNVPREIGKWEITKVFISAAMPDNVISSVECVQVAGIWVATIPASTAAGISTNGYTITANGVKEDGTTAVTGYILGKGDIEIINADGTITQGETTYYFHLLQAAPETPHKGDAYVDAGAWKIYNGQSWVVLGGVTGSGQYVQSPTAYGGDGKWHRVIIADGALAYDDEGIDEPPESASKVWVSAQIAAETDRAQGVESSLDADIAQEAAARAAADTAEAARAAAAEATKVSLSGDESISGTKTFNSSPVVPNPSSNTQAANKLYVDTKAAALVTAHTSLTNNPHGVTKAQVGLGNCDNTSDANKPISTATQTALNAKANDSEVVKLSGNQIVGGIKNFTSDIISLREGSSVFHRNRFSNMERGDNATYGQTAAFDLEDKNAAMLLRLSLAAFTNDGRREATLLGYDDSGNPVVLASLVCYPDGRTRVNGAPLASASMPSVVAEASIALPESGGYVTFAAGTASESQNAPYSGWIYFQKTANSGEYIKLVSYAVSGVGVVSQIYSPSSNAAITACVPICKGNKVQVVYTASGDFAALRYTKNSAE